MRSVLLRLLSPLCATPIIIPALCYSDYYPRSVLLRLLSPLCATPIIIPALCYSDYYPRSVLLRLLSPLCATPIIIPALCYSDYYPRSVLLRLSYPALLMSADKYNRGSDCFGIHTLYPLLQNDRPEPHQSNYGYVGPFLNTVITVISAVHIQSAIDISKSNFVLNNSYLKFIFSVTKVYVV